MKHEVISDNVLTSDDVIRRVLTLAPLSGSPHGDPKVELGADQLTSIAWPATGRVFELTGNRIQHEGNTLSDMKPSSVATAEQSINQSSSHYEIHH